MQILLKTQKKKEKQTYMYNNWNLFLIYLKDKLHGGFKIIIIILPYLKKTAFFTSLI